MATLKTNTISPSTGTSVAVTAASIVLTGAVSGVTTLSATTITATGVTATTFNGNLTGLATTATTVTGVTQSNITSCPNLTVTGELGLLNVVRLDATTTGTLAAMTCTANSVCGKITTHVLSAATAQITVTNTKVQETSLVFLQPGGGVPATTVLNLGTIAADSFIILISGAAVPVSSKIHFLVIS